MNFKKAITEILKFKKVFDKIDDKIPKKLLGELGEFYVLDKLQKKGFKNLKPKGGKAGFDISIEDNNKEIKIEVKTSLLKNENIYSKGINFFGWRVKNKNQKKEHKFDIMVGVALDETFKKPKFYIFTYKEAFRVGDVSGGRFPNIQKKIHLFKNEKEYRKAIENKPEQVTEYERYINEHRHEFLDKWSKIKNS